MLDKNGKLFGKVNIIDLLIVLVVIAAVVLVALRFGGNDNDFGEPHRVRLTFFAPDAPALLEGKAQPGDPVYDFDYSFSLGTLHSYETEPAYTNALSPVNGAVVQVPTVNECFLTFTCDVETAYMAADGLRINGFAYPIGGSNTICMGQARVACRLADIEVLD